MSAILGDVCSFLNGGTPSRSVARYFEGDIPWITGADIDGPMVNEARSFITDEAVSDSATNLVPAGTILLVTRTSVGKVAIAGTPLCFSQDITAITPDPDEVDTGYLVHLLRTKQPHFERLARGATIKGITRETVADIRVPLPPLAEQRRIAEILTNADALRAKRRAALAQLDTLTQSIFLDMFGEPARNERKWPIVKVLELCELVRGASPRPQGDPRFFGGPVPRLMVADITRDGWRVTPAIDSLTIEGAKRSRPVPAGTVVMAVSGNVGLVSRLAINACVHDGFVAFARLDERRCQPGFLLALLHFSKALHDKHKAGAIFINLTTTDIKAMPLPLPPIELQREFARRVTAVEKLKTAHRAWLAELDNAFASLQHRAFRGEL